MKKKVSGYFSVGQPTSLIRDMLLDAILKYSEDELNEFSLKEFIELAKESDAQLVERLINILKYYHHAHNS